MKWYWILLIVLGVIALAAVITMAVKKSKTKASLPAKAVSIVKDTVKAGTDAVKTTVASSGDVDVIKTTNADGSGTIAVARKM
jgi:uncharacterized protein (UPF0333 family)